MDKSKGRWCWRYFFITKVSFTMNSHRRSRKKNILCPEKMCINPLCEKNQKEIGRKQMGFTPWQCPYTSITFRSKLPCQGNITVLQHPPIHLTVPADLYLFFQLKMKWKGLCFVYWEGYLICDYTAEEAF